jgi:hypothetical protein
MSPGLRKHTGRAARVFSNANLKQIPYGRRISPPFPISKSLWIRFQLIHSPHAVLADELYALAGKKILNLSMYTNTDLKMTYGPANLDTLSACDDAYADLILLLNKIGKTLLEANDVSSAEQFLSYAVSIGSDITASYTMLATIYANKHDTDHLDELIRKAESITSLSGKTIQIKLHSIKSGLK